jgi:hypothetical protein
MYLCLSWTAIINGSSNLNRRLSSPTCLSVNFCPFPLITSSSSCAVFSSRFSVGNNRRLPRYPSIYADLCKSCGQHQDFRRPLEELRNSFHLDEFKLYRNLSSRCPVLWNRGVSLESWTCLKILRRAFSPNSNTEILTAGNTIAWVQAGKFIGSASFCLPLRCFIAFYGEVLFQSRGVMREAELSDASGSSFWLHSLQPSRVVIFLQEFHVLRNYSALLVLLIPGW